MSIRRHQAARKNHREKNSARRPTRKELSSSELIREQIKATKSDIQLNSQQLIDELGSLKVDHIGSQVTDLLFTAVHHSGQDIIKNELKIKEHTKHYLKQHKVSSALLASFVLSWLAEHQQNSTRSGTSSNQSERPENKAEDPNSSDLSSAQAKFPVRQAVFTLGFGLIAGWTLQS